MLACSIEPPPPVHRVSQSGGSVEGGALGAGGSSDREGPLECEGSFRGLLAGSGVTVSVGGTAWYKVAGVLLS